MPDAVLPLAPGTVMERYTILSVLGQGACGIAYLSQDEELGRRLLLKEHAPAGLCRRELSTGEIQPLPGCESAYIQSLSSFLQEASVLAKLRLPAVPEVYEVFEAGGTACSILSYVEGRDLSQWLAEQPERRSLLPMVLAEALRALGKLHRLGVRHRDLKPGHIILDGAGAVNFIDFGVACAAGTADAAELVPAFTPPYSPPEQGVAELECAASDLYALAATFYEVTLGQKGSLPSAPERLEGAFPQTLAAQNALQSEFSLPYLATLDKALSLEPQARYATAEQWLAALTKPAEAKAPLPVSPRRWWLWGLGVAACLAAAFCALYVPSHQEVPSPVVEPQSSSAEPLYALQRVVAQARAASQSADSPSSLYTQHDADTVPDETAVCTSTTYDLPGGIFCSEQNFCPTWQGVCTRIDLLDTENLTEEYLSPLFAMVWKNNSMPDCSPDKLVLVLTDASGQELARSAPHEYDPEKRILSFNFLPPLHLPYRDMFYVKPLKELPAGWKACLRLPMEDATGNPSRRSPKNTPELPLRARQAVFYIQQ